ncbi:hypothetical protein Mgra_00010150 [Meloidogyne graminicola]|uniref:G-protein coupled receptors family 1 profile domain-containing protein n=1 Tax=Meloidogyne graminicola TaxID=189291 RepID=A0A8S9ZCR2_9BILA|nr:hypothetical protein Mgra_00010150 [Meloidogyne graminicola]
MTIDEVYNNYLNIFSIILCTSSAIFLLILINPLYKFSKERTALFILLSKSCANILYQFRQIYVCIYRYFPFSQYYWSYFFIQPSAILLINAAYFHVIMLALNRFHAVFFPFNYQNWWKKRFKKYLNIKLINFLRNIKYFILITWVITLVCSILQYIATKCGL